jgi:glycosyltransferase involved in cell wall biosynthesis
MDLIVSLNRFDPSKKVENGLDGFLELLQTWKNTSKKLVLVIAGGYEASVTLNTEYLASLIRRIPVHVPFTILWDDIQRQEWKIGDSSIVFLPNVSEAQKAQLLLEGKALMYTPDAEHFGIVPLEVMLSRGAMLVGVAGGGVKETLGEMCLVQDACVVLKDETKARGIAVSVPGKPKDYATALEFILDEANAPKLKSMKTNAVDFVRETFTTNALEGTLDDIIVSL